MLYGGVLVSRSAPVMCCGAIRSLRLPDLRGHPNARVVVVSASSVRKPARLDTEARTVWVDALELARRGSGSGRRRLWDVVDERRRPR